MQTWVYRRPHISTQRSIVRTVAPWTVAAQAFPEGPGRPSSPSGATTQAGALAGMGTQCGPTQGRAVQSGPEQGQGV